MLRIIIKPTALPSIEPRMHEHPCAKCPSAHWGPDPEAEEIKTYPHEERVMSVFRCAWRPTLYCKGVCDEMGVTNADLERLRPKVVTVEHVD